jgi:two-component system chemotaxis response regulator CheB
VFTCPECHGTLWEAEEGGLLRFRCRVGHVYSPDSMLSAQTDDVDRALWIALRTLEERAALSHRLASRGRARDHHWVDRAFTQRARDAEREANQIRGLLRTRVGAHSHTVPDDTAAATTPDGPGDPEPVKPGR